MSDACDNCGRDGEARSAERAAERGAAPDLHGLLERVAAEMLDALDAALDNLDDPFARGYLLGCCAAKGFLVSKLKDDVVAASIPDTSPKS